MQVLPPDLERYRKIAGEQYDEAKLWRDKEFKARATKNWEYYVGQQWAGVALPAWKMKATVNHIARIVRHHLPYLTDARPQMAIYGRGAEDVDRAKIADLLFQFKWDQLHMDVRRALAYLNALIFGIGWFKPRIDPTLRGGLGDLDVAVIDPWHVLVDPSATWSMSPVEAIENAEYVIHEVPKPISKVRRQLRALAKDPQAAARAGLVEGALEALERMSGGAAELPPWSKQAFVTAGGVAVETIPLSSATGVDRIYVPTSPGGPDPGDDRHMVTMREHWIRNEQYPQGYVVTMIDDLLVMARPNPLEHGEVPFIPLVCNVLPGRLYGYGVVDDLIPIQDEYNKRRSQIMDIMNLYQGPPLMAEKGGIDPDVTSIAPGAIIEYTLGRKPEFLVLPQVPPDAWRSLDRAEGEFDRLSNIREVLQGEFKAGTAGIAMEQAAEAALAPIRMMERLNNAAFITLGRQSFAIMQQLYRNTGYIIRVTGPAGEQVPAAVAPDDIQGWFDFEFIPNSAYSLRRQVWFKQLADLRAMGAPVPWDALIDQTDLPNKEKIKKVIQVEEQRMAQQAAAEAQMQQQGQAPQGPPPQGGQ